MSGTEGASLKRIIIAGLSGDSGKTFVSLGIVRALRQKGIRITAFKKGPDFIDAAWLGRAAGNPGRNLDTFLMPEKKILESLHRAFVYQKAEIAVTEGNRGLFDGVDSRGSHSTAELSKLIKAPIILVVDTTKTTRTIAAMILGCKVLDPEVEIAGVILNRVGTARQESVIRSSILADVGIPVLGAIPRVNEQNLPDRHLGLVTEVEHPQSEEAIERCAEIVRNNLNLEQVLKISSNTADLKHEPIPIQFGQIPNRVRIGVLRDKAFSFYYPENFEALEEAGGELVDMSPLEDEEPPGDIQGLYAGGGFPEVFAERLSSNREFRNALRKQILSGIPVWAECGGLMYLSEAVQIADQTYPMTGVLPFSIRQMPKPQGHGYVRAFVEKKNPFFEIGTQITGHEFHYSRISGDVRHLETVMALEKGIGVGFGRDGVAQDKVVATYTHLHAMGTPGWAPSLIDAAEGSFRN
jgi:cobyrinic acid a,c-diamide synthase